jgi:VIT1/CCC1 family predicted Fe2+/Mn2+ transporter
LIAGFAGLAAGAMSMAAGEYVSVSSQADTEKADLARETRELADDVEAERKELAGLYAARGLTPELAKEVAIQLMAHDALGAHARDELGITESRSARPVQAAAASAVTFMIGAAVPVVLAALVPRQHTIVAVVLTTLCILATLGAVAAKVGGAPMWVGTLRVTFWGGLAMAVTAGVGALFHITMPRRAGRRPMAAAAARHSRSWNCARNRYSFLPGLASTPEPVSVTGEPLGSQEASRVNLAAWPRQ